MPSWHCSLTIFFSVESSKSSLPKGGSRKEDAIFSGRSTMFVEIPGQGGSKIAFPTRNNGASASPYKGNRKQPRHENKVSVENGKLRVALKELSGNKYFFFRHPSMPQRRGCKIPRRILRWKRRLKVYSRSFILYRDYSNSLALSHMLANSSLGWSRAVTPYGPPKKFMKIGRFMGKFRACLCFISLIHTTWWDDIHYEILFPVNCILPAYLAVFFTWASCLTPKFGGHDRKMSLQKLARMTKKGWNATKNWLDVLDTTARRDLLRIREEQYGQSVSLISKSTTLHLHLIVLSTFLCHHFTTTACKCRLTLRFIKDVNKWRRSFFPLWAGAPNDCFL